MLLWIGLVVLFVGSSAQSMDQLYNYNPEESPMRSGSEIKAVRENYVPLPTPRPLPIHSLNEMGTVRPNYAPRPLPTMSRVVGDDAQVPDNVEFDNTSAERKFLLPIASNIGKLLTSGGLIENFSKYGFTIIRGIADYLSKEAAAQMNTNKSVSRGTIFLLEAVKFIYETLDFYTKKGGFLVKIITWVCKKMGRLFGKMGQKMSRVE